MPPDLWRFALTVYAQPGVTAACLRLQDKGADVCLLLCGAWLEQRGLACTAPRVQQLSALAGPWQAAVITPLRQLRQSWRTAALADAQVQGWREQIKALELEAERELLRRLEQAVLSWPEREVQRAPDAWLERLAPGADAGAEGAAGTDQEYCAALQLLRGAITVL